MVVAWLLVELPDEGCDDAPGPAPAAAGGHPELVEVDDVAFLCPQYEPKVFK